MKNKIGTVELYGLQLVGSLNCRTPKLNGDAECWVSLGTFQVQQCHSKSKFECSIFFCFAAAVKSGSVPPGPFLWFLFLRLLKNLFFYIYIVRGYPKIFPNTPRRVICLFECIGRRSTICLHLTCP